MALLVVNASSKVSQGVLKRLYASGTYEKIIAADLYPNYYAIERFLRFKSELDGIQTKPNSKISNSLINPTSSEPSKEALTSFTLLTTTIN